MRKVGLILLMFSVPLMESDASAATVKRLNRIESFRRQLPRGRGSFQRLGMVGELESQSIAASAGESPTKLGEWYQTLSEVLSMQFRANTMFFASDNIFNTQHDKERDTQYAQFVGVSLDAQFDKNWSLSNTYDEGWFYYGKAANALNDYTPSTFGQTLTYERQLFHNKATLTLPFGWAFTRLFDRATGARTLDTYTYTGSVDFSWLLNDWCIPDFSYMYNYMDSGSTTGPVPDKHRHAFNLGITFVPMKGRKLYLTPSMQYYYEQFIGVVRSDTAWSPTMTVSWQPLKHLAVDVIGNYTDSKSTLEDSSYKVLNGTLFLRLFFDW